MNVSSIILLCSKFFFNLWYVFSISNKCFVSQPNWEILDPICTLLLPIFELTNTYIIIRVTMAVLREDMPKEVNFVDVLETFMKIEGVDRVPNLRTRALSPDSTIMTAHLAVSMYHSVYYMCT